ncbi:hypothetical protein [Pectobacterium carotovorum]|uniref:hypothetical protein n=1 Tax=Pectobacterium carotovorum TaxID=554 RepID=UPI000580AC08|nr:hypothetical protein [Pectobacterium carotovorum]KHT34459.1 hypothetical protein RD01_06110 [Pectobacterium carotovorum subsp. carotovorum]
MKSLASVLVQKAKDIAPDEKRENDERCYEFLLKDVVAVALYLTNSDDEKERIAGYKLQIDIKRLFSEDKHHKALLDALGNELPDFDRDKATSDSISPHKQMNDLWIKRCSDK